MSTRRAARLREALRGDCHVHSDWSDGGSPIREMAEAARDQGLKVLAITVPHNEGSLAFHRQMGFRFREEGGAWSGTVPLVPDYAGPGVHCVIMERKL